MKNCLFSVASFSGCPPAILGRWPENELILESAVIREFSWTCHFCAFSGVSVDVQLSESGVVVRVEAAGAESIGIIVRDSSNGRHMRKGYVSRTL